MRARLLALWGRLTWKGRDWRAQFLRFVAEGVDGARKAWREIVTVALGLGGWGILTHVVVGFVGTIAWEVSAGLLCLSLFGWKLAYVVARDGVYALSQRGKKS